MNATLCNPLVEDYFAQLDSRLADLPQKQRKDFLMELRAHVTDRLQQASAPSDEICQAILDALGAPEEIARQYRLEVILNRSSWKISPISVFRILLRGTLSGIQGMVIFCIAFIGYSLSLCFYVAAILKPIFPHNVGAFVSSHGLNLARFPEPPSGHDVLGPAFLPVAVILGYLLTLATTLLLRAVNSRSRRLKQRLL